VLVCVDSVSKKTSLDTGDAASESLLSSIDKLSDACEIRSVLPVTFDLLIVTGSLGQEICEDYTCKVESITDCNV